MTNPDDMLAEHLAGYTVKTLRKRKLREDLRRRLEENTGNPEAVVREVAAYIGERPGLKTVAIYSALPGEVELDGLLAKTERSWVFPKVEGQDLAFYEVRNVAKDMRIGAFGILEPKKGTRRVNISEIDLFLCPGLGFDPRGGRIGRGKGFYDRVLAGARVDAVKLGVCYGFQLVEDVEMEEHDIRMNGVIAG